MSKTDGLGNFRIKKKKTQEICDYVDRLGSSEKIISLKNSITSRSIFSYELRKMEMATLQDAWSPLLQKQLVAMDCELGYS